MDTATAYKPKMDHQLTIRQIGAGNLMACGARDFVSDTSSLTFRVGSKRGLLEKVVVMLDPDDTYSVRYVAYKGKSYTLVEDESLEMVYADQLGAVVRRMGDR